MRRDPMPWLLLLLLTVLGSVAYLTRYPEHPVLERLAEWPVIGSAAERFRKLYRPAPSRRVERGTAAGGHCHRARNRWPARGVGARSAAR